ncbi:hypothetical protein [Comamonas aquatica]|nr:hypothetical protein [Comamonas aquatica]
MQSYPPFDCGGYEHRVPALPGTERPTAGARCLRAYFLRVST